MSWNNFTSLELEDIFCFPSLEKEHQLNNLLEHAFQQYSNSTQDDSTPEILWAAERYNLHKSRYYQKLSTDKKQNYLLRMTELNMALSIWIEKSGHLYGAKMILLSESQQEKSLYSLFAAEEAIHQREFSNFLTFRPDWATHNHPMLIPLGNAIREGSRETLIFIVQVLLEGFGMSHYAGLMEDCLHQPLKNTYARILKDEARHHGAGLILANDPTNQIKLEGESFEQIFEYTRQFISALQSAHWLKQSFNDVNCPMSATEESLFWEEIDQDKTLAYRRQKLKEMIAKTGQSKLLSALEKEKLF